MIIGNIEEITSDVKRFNGTSLQFDKSLLDYDSHFDIFTAQEQIKTLKNQLVEKEKEILSYKQSKSWKITKLFRDVFNFFRNKKYK